MMTFVAGYQVSGSEAHVMLYHNFHLSIPVGFHGNCCFCYETISCIWLCCICLCLLSLQFVHVWCFSSLIPRPFCNCLGLGVVFWQQPTLSLVPRLSWNANIYHLHNFDFAFPSVGAWERG